MSVWLVLNGELHFIDFGSIRPDSLLQDNNEAKNSKKAKFQNPKFKCQKN